MCGINGIVSFRAGAPLVDLDELTRTREAMRSRGPDAAGYVFGRHQAAGQKKESQNGQCHLFHHFSL